MKEKLKTSEHLYGEHPEVKELVAELSTRIFNECVRDKREDVSLTYTVILNSLVRIMCEFIERMAIGKDEQKQVVIVLAKQMYMSLTGEERDIR